MVGGGLGLRRVSRRARRPAPKNPYELKKATPRAPRKAVDEALTRALAEKIEDCYREEQQAPMGEEDRKLLETFGSEVAHDLAPGFKYTSCHVDKVATPRCLQDLAALDCAMLAEPIVAAGWDRNLTPEAKAKVRAYATSLSARLSACEGRQGEEAAITGGARIDQLSVLIESEIVIGRCELRADRQTHCDELLRDSSCETVMSAHGRGEIQQFCDELYTCAGVRVADPEN